MAFAHGLCDLFADPRSVFRQKLKAKKALKTVMARLRP